MKLNMNFILLNISFIFLLVILIYIIKIKSKTQIRYAFLGFISSLIIWTFGYLGFFYWYYLFGYDATIFIKIIFTGIILTPLSVYFSGYLFAYTRINFTLRFKILFILPIISLIMIYTNEYHYLFYTYFTAKDITFRIFGPWFTVHTLYSYLLIFMGLGYLVYFTIKNSGFFSNQSKAVILGLLFPLIINMLITFEIGNLPYYFESIAFSLAGICFTLAIFKFKFLNIAPIALQKIVDLISDSFIVVNEEFNVIDYNKTFFDTFSKIFKIRRNGNIIDILQSNPAADSAVDDFNRAIFEAKESKKSITFEKQIKSGTFDKYFTVEITPIISDNSFIGTIILLKDITQVKKNIETIKENQAMLMERERLASLGQLIAGIAHNLKTPIMSLSGGIEALRDLVKEYDESIDDSKVTKEDHHEIASEMYTWLNKMKPYCSYMSDVISAVKGQAILMNESTTISFTLDELMKRVYVLMKHELKRYHCKLNTEFLVDMNTEIKGEVNNLVQVFDNIIVNAIQAYEEEYGQIDLKIYRKGNNLEICFRDYGKGISSEIKERLFKEMVTTKGKKGTGLGLYMSYSTIKGKFGGNMWFESEEGKGTAFYISLPLVNDSTCEEVS